MEIYSKVNPKRILQLVFPSTGIRNAVEDHLTSVWFMDKAVTSRIFGYTYVAWNPQQEWTLTPFREPVCRSVAFSVEVSIMASMSVL